MKVKYTQSGFKTIVANMIISFILFAFFYAIGISVDSDTYKAGFAFGLLGGLFGSMISVTID